MIGTSSFKCTWKRLPCQMARGFRKAASVPSAESYQADGWQLEPWLGCDPIKLS